MTCTSNTIHNENWTVKSSVSEYGQILPIVFSDQATLVDAFTSCFPLAFVRVFFLFSKSVVAVLPITIVKQFYMIVLHFVRIDTIVSTQFTV